MISFLKRSSRTYKKITLFERSDNKNDGNRDISVDILTFLAYLYIGTFSCNSIFGIRCKVQNEIQ